MPVYYRSNQAEIHVANVSGGIALPWDTESWDMMEGGDPVAEQVEIYPGGESPQVALGGLSKWSPVVVERAWAESLANLYKAAANNVGQAPITVAYIQRFGNKPTGLVFTYTGVLVGAERPKYQSKESVEAYLKITVSINGLVT